MVRDSCGGEATGETPQSGARGGSPRGRGKRVPSTQINDSAAPPNYIQRMGSH
ncbi:hypothetical protein JMA_30450 [Jeotgalibacillus malaysiensis]|uniref:Uncharacterized protein n=1 Tax=Jeotgalibacillus malaysiensis TaxID=1508404 RepID=A0A0B5AUH6_9BACL|nr:hypothetical protein JMA_30450 [Jeotgalibacillus malaysiensis]